MDFREMILLRQKELVREKKELERKLRRAPAGVLTCHRRGETYKWYQNYDHEKRIYIPKKESALAEQLAFKAYQQKQLLDVEQELCAIETYLRKSPPLPGRAQQLLQKSAGIRDLIGPKLHSLPEKLALWEQEPYQKNPGFPEHLNVPSVRGEMMRSKSESMIAYVLYEKGIPFRYECATELSGIIYYPDFTIMRPCDGTIFIWEHLGRIDDPDYLADNASKMHLYMMNGWIPGRNLIITSETADNIFDISSIPKIVEFYFGV